MKHHTAARFILGLSLTFATALPNSRATTLVKQGVPCAVVALPPEPTETERLAAQELIAHIEKISGAKLEMATVEVGGAEAFAADSAKAGRIPIFLGRTVFGRHEKQLGSVSDWDGTFILKVTGNRIDITGLGEGNLYGVYELLEQVGVRWFMPGELGTVIPDRKTIDITEQETVQAPSFPSRFFQMQASKEWFQRTRCGGARTFPSCHGLPGMTKGVFKEHPEFFALINGERSTRQHCISNPQVLELVIATIRKRLEGNPNIPIIGLGPNDGAGFCECDECRKLDAGDYDPFSGEGSVTDRYVWFFNQILENLEKDYPTVKLGFYIYHNYMRPPVNVQPRLNLTGALAPIALCRIHGPNNPLCPEKQYYERLAQAWGKLLPELWERGYWSNLACPGFPFIIVHRLREQIPACKEAGVTGWRVETFANWGSQLPSFYVAAKLMWNAEEDVDALMADFFEKFFGPASGPMGQYITLMDRALRDADYHTGSSWDMPHLYPAALRREARTLLAKGARAARGKGIYEQRVTMITETFDLLDHFVAMLDARTGGDFADAKKHIDNLDAVAEQLMSYDPPMLLDGRHSTYINYMRRFYRPCTEQAYARVTDGNTLAAVLKDEWDFLVDPLKIGEDLDYWTSELTGGNWQRIKTSSSSWSNQGLRYYKGLAWYRQKVDIPGEFKGKRIFLWCGGVDEKAKVWVNGKEVGISPGASFYPFEVDATGAVRAGEANVVAMCVANESVNEIGTGGLVAPVFFYAPAAGKDAELENTRPLGRTFP